MKIIAEVGSNWATLDDCKKSIQLAKACGADAVKFQLFNYAALYGKELETVRVWGDNLGNAGHSATPYVMPGQLPLEWLPILKEKADAHGIEFMCSAFSPELIDAVNPFVKTHKVASAELTHVRMLEKLRVIGKPVILSTGASGSTDVAMAVKMLGPIDVTLMYCVAEYPARTVRLLDMLALVNSSGRHLRVGFSDHTTDVLEIPKRAQELHASVIEKHVNFVGATGPDADYALTTDEFMQMCKNLRGERVSGPKEADMRARHNRRLIVTRDVGPGDTFREGENFGIYRSLKDDTQALSPWLIDRVNGKPVQQALRAGDGIGPGAVTL